MVEIDEVELKVLRTKAERLDKVLESIRVSLKFYAEHEIENYFEHAFKYEGLLKIIFGENE